ncbi:MAG: tetratricopeptide repeat protein [Candidatus Acidoferrales bacterium]
MPDWSFRSRWRRAAALLLGLVLLAVAARGSLRGALVARARTSQERALLERALRLADDDAALHHLLAQWEQFSLEGGSPERALLHYRRAAQLNPHESLYWLDLADALLLAGDGGGAADAVAQALQVDPRTPETLWRAGNFWLRAGQPARSYPYFHRALTAQPNLAPLVVRVSHRLLGDPDLVLRQALPAQPRFFLVYLRYLLTIEDNAAAARVWDRLMEQGGSFQLRQGLFYLDSLIRHQQAPQAEKVWNDLKRLGLVDAGSSSLDGELLHNPDLRQPILNGGFGWRAVVVANVNLHRGPARSGSQTPALVIRFFGEKNLEYRHFFQYVLVEPNRRYRFQAWMSTEEITTESGPRLEVAEVGPGGGVARSPGLVGSHGWFLEQVELTTGPQTRLLRVGIVRLRSRRVSNQIRGTVRVSEFSLRRLERGS